MAQVLVTGMSGSKKRPPSSTNFVGGGTSRPTPTTTGGSCVAEHPDLIASFTVENQGRFYDRFEHVVLLGAPPEVLLQRVSTRTNDPYGKTNEHWAEIAGLRADRRTAPSARRDPRTRRATYRVRTRRCHREGGDRNILICRGVETGVIWFSFASDARLGQFAQTAPRRLPLPGAPSAPGAGRRGRIPTP